MVKMMNNQDLTYKFIATLNNKKDPIDDLKELDKGENGILKTLFIYEETKNQNLTPSELCLIQKLTSGRIATTLKSLEKKKYITRCIDSIDRRKIIVKLTESGKTAAKKIVDRICNSIQKIINKLGEKDASEFIRIFNLLKS